MKDLLSTHSLASFVIDLSSFYEVGIFFLNASNSSEEKKGHNLGVVKTEVKILFDQIISFMVAIYIPYGWQIIWKSPAI